MILRNLDLSLSVLIFRGLYTYKKYKVSRIFEGMLYSKIFNSLTHKTLYFLSLGLKNDQRIGANNLYNKIFFPSYDKIIGFTNLAKVKRKRKPFKRLLPRARRRRRRHYFRFKRPLIITYKRKKNSWWTRFFFWKLKKKKKKKIRTSYISKLKPNFLKTKLTAKDKFKTYIYIHFFFKQIYINNSIKFLNYRKLELLSFFFPYIILNYQNKL